MNTGARLLKIALSINSRQLHSYSSNRTDSSLGELAWKASYVFSVGIVLFVVSSLLHPPHQFGSSKKLRNPCQQK